MARYVELRRHTHDDGDVLTEAGIQAALALGRSLTDSYSLVVSSGAQRATQTAGCILAGLGRSVAGGVVVESGLRSQMEDRWREAYRVAGAGDLASLLSADPELGRADTARLAAGLARVFERLGDDERALVIGHSPTNEAAVYGLTGVMVPPLAKGEGVTIVATGDDYEVAPLHR